MCSQSTDRIYTTAERPRPGLRSEGRRKELRRLPGQIQKAYQWQSKQSTQRRKRISFSRIEPHQADYLDDWSKDPEAIALVIVSFSLKKFYSVPWPFWKAARTAWEQKKGKKNPEKEAIEAYGWEWTTPGMASVSEEQMLPDWEIKTGGRSGLPYLEIIDKMTRG